MPSDANTDQEPDMYGQVHPNETPMLVAKKRVEFEVEIEKLKPDAKKNLLLAQERCPELLTDDFKLMFLRCEVFNADLAAIRFAKYWDKRVEIFGPSKAFLPLKLSMALKGDETAMQYGFFTVTGTTDASGRGIVYVDPSKQDKRKYSRESMCRTLWYIMHAVLEQESTQRRGVVMLSYSQHSKLNQMDRPLAKMNIESLKGCIPARMSVIHVCHPPAYVAMVLPVFKIFMGERMRKRLQVHSGSQEKVLEHIATFGLPKESVPSDLGGEAVVDHLGWLEQRRAADL